MYACPREMSVPAIMKLNSSKETVELSNAANGKLIIEGGRKKQGHKFMTIILSNLNWLKKIFTGRFLGKFAIKQILKITSHLTYVATLRCETLMSAKQALNDKLQGSVAVCLRCGGVVSKQIKKGLFLSLWVKKLLKSVNIWQSYKQERDCLVHFLSLLAVCWPHAQSAWDNHTLACNFAKYSPILNFFSPTHSGTSTYITNSFIPIDKNAY